MTYFFLDYEENKAEPEERVCSVCTARDGDICGVESEIKAWKQNFMKVEQSMCELTKELCVKENLVKALSEDCVNVTAEKDLSARLLCELQTKLVKSEEMLEKIRWEEKFAEENACK
jgi:t-SNARE complex subunit (syntaxin)